MGTTFCALMTMDMFTCLNLLTFKLYAKLLVHLDPKFEDCSTQEIHKMKCPTKRKKITKVLCHDFYCLFGIL